jgi:hypothetical protein
MKRQEYLSVKVTEGNTIHGTANHYASEGWEVKQVITEVVTVTVNLIPSNQTAYVILFERELQKVPTSELTSRTSALRWS